MKSLKPDLTSSKDLSEGTLSYTTPAITKPFKLEKITLRADGAITETITITRLAGSYVQQASPVTLAGTAKGSNYDLVIGKVSLIAEQDHVFTPREESDFQPGEQIKVECTNDNETGEIVYVSVKRSEIR